MEIVSLTSEAYKVLETADGYAFAAIQLPSILWAIAIL